MSVPDGYLRLEEAAKFERLSYEAMKKRCQRKAIVLANDPTHRQRKLIPVSALSSSAYQEWLKSQAFPRTTASELPPASKQSPEPDRLLPASASDHLVAGGEAAPASPRLQPLLPFRPSPPADPAPVPPVSERHKPLVTRKLGVIAQCLNHEWKKYEGQIVAGYAIHNAHDYICALARLQGKGFSISAIYEMKKLAHDVMRDRAIPADRKWSVIAERLGPRPRVGKANKHFFASSDPGVIWQWPFLASVYLNQAKLSARRAYELLLDEIEQRERAAQGECLYPRPTYWQCWNALKKTPLVEKTLARDGEKAFTDRCAPFISRRPPAHANDVWVTDQRLCNVRLRDGGERLGRVWVVNFLDVASWRWLGCMFGPVLNSDIVMAAAAMSLERAGVPRAIHMDLGKEFIGKRFLGGTFKLRGETLYRDAIGLWERLETRVITAIGRNPQSKIIERWHRELDRFDQELPGWCGSNPDERPEKLAREEAAHEAWLRSGDGRSPLLTIPQYIERYLAFCEHRWNRDHRGRGKYLQGMTPQEAWNTRQPPGGVRRLTPDEIDFYTADHRFVTISRGGQVNLAFDGVTIEYHSPELLTRQGEEVEAIVSRRSLQTITVLYRVPGGTASCIARAKPRHQWLPENRDELRQALRCRAALRRALKRGLAAREALAGASSLRELPAIAAEIAPGIAAHFGELKHPEISSTEFIGRKMQLAKRREPPRFAADIVKDALKIEGANAEGGDPS